MTNSLVRDAPHPVAPAWATITAVSAHLWRVGDHAGRILGHIRARATDEGWRFAAERFFVADHAFRRLGEFWRPDDALECLRYLR
jgi:hypothetical protein